MANKSASADHLRTTYLKGSPERILVCGGRDYSDQAALFGALDMQAEQTSIDCVIHGGADGADRLSHLWAKTRGVRREVFHADWNTHCRAAGPIRNQRMIEEGRPTMVFAFPGGRGTADMVRRAEAAGVPVYRFPAAGRGP